MTTDERTSSGGAVPGLLKGLATTARTMLRPAHTGEYPHAPPALPPRSRGVIALLEENCTSCMLCARECPDWCIYIDSHKETLPAETPGGRERQRNVLDRFAIDFSLCMYCGICIEVCPFDALFWSPQFEYAETDIRDLLHEKERLAAWMPTVPPPPALDEHSAEPAEVTAANKPARAPRGAAGPTPRRAEHPTPSGSGRDTERVPAARRGDETDRLPTARRAGARGQDETEQIRTPDVDTRQLPTSDETRTAGTDSAAEGDDERTDS